MAVSTWALSAVMRGYNPSPLFPEKKYRSKLTDGKSVEER
jgi:hypothetical protein